jgi:drug/metabolite transporter (DMT)-like permease
MVAVGLAVLSTVAYAFAALNQRRAAIGEPRLGRQLRRPIWWLAIALLGTGAVLHVAALRFGALALVQPLGALTLVFAVPLAAWTERRSPTRREGWGVVAAVIGLVALLVLTRPTGTAHPLEAPTTAGVAGLCLALLALVAVATQASPRAQGVGFAFAAGISSAVASSFTQTVLVAGGWQQAVPAAAAVGVFIVCGMLLSQLSYRRSLSAPLATATITNPVASAVFGTLVLGEQVATGTIATAAGLIAAAVAAIGVVLLAHTRPGLAQLR